MHKNSTHLGRINKNVEKANSLKPIVSWNAVDAKYKLKIGGPRKKMAAKPRFSQGCQIFLGPNIPNWKKYTK
jgi:hypothetical protein